MKRANVFETTQIGVEATPGTATTALKRLLCTGIDFSPINSAEEFRPYGSKAATDMVVGKEHSEGSVEGSLAYFDICYLLSMMFGSVTPSSLSTTVRRWTWKPKNFDPDPVTTLTVEKGGPLGASRITHAMLNALTLTFADKQAKVSGSILGKNVTDGVQMSRNEVQTVQINASSGTFTLTYVGQTTTAIQWNAAASAVTSALEALSNISPGDVSVTKDGQFYAIEFRGNWRQQEITPLTVDVSAGTGSVTETIKGVAPTDVEKKMVLPKRTTIYVASSVDTLAENKLTDCLEAELAISDRFGTHFPLDADAESFSDLIEKAPTLAGRLVVVRDSVADAMTSALKSGATRFMRIICDSGTDEIEVGYPYQIQITFPFKFKQDQRGEQQATYGSTYSLIPVYDSTFGGYLEIIVDNTLTSL